MLINEVTSFGAMPALAQVLRFAGQRQRILAHNVANIETPDFRPADVDPKHFQGLLGEAIGDRRRRTGGGHGELRLPGSSQVRTDRAGGFALVPRTPSVGVLGHDRNNKDMERLMQDVVENVGMFRLASDLLRHQGQLLRSAITERP